ncbi:hypothetical protein CCH79_00010729 [Gambusia affinis]|uniref:PH domain-containing protein n=1 Tax=Gambusia affinis TaxID=33528 RepID=A0A315W560_GAMAF|nr:hypothetical protein CCH79_00010729 [Gambusia affinis]
MWLWLCTQKLGNAAQKTYQYCTAQGSARIECYTYDYKFNPPAASDFEGQDAAEVLSHNLCTVLSIPHDPVALEEHFRDDDDGPVSSQGYMPYLNKYILDKVVEGSFNKENVDELCWTLTAKKNYQPDRSSNSVLPDRDAFRLWCLFNFLSEDKYPLVMVPDERLKQISSLFIQVEYLLKKICMAMSIEFNCVELDDFFSQDSGHQNGITVWVFLQMMNSGKITRAIDKSIISMAIEEVYREIVGDVLKEGYLWKKGQLRRNWKERWFTLRPSNLCYYTGEDRKDCQGNIVLDGNCCVEVSGEHSCFSCLSEKRKTKGEDFPNMQKAAQRKLRQASTNVKHWNVQMNRLMRPIGPGEKRPSLGSSFQSFQIPTQRDPGLRLRRKSGSEDQSEESKENVDNRTGCDLEKRHSHASNGDMDIP